MYKDDQTVRCLDLSSGSFLISTFSFPEEAEISSLASAILSSFRVLLAYTVKATIVMIATMKEITL